MFRPRTALLISVLSGLSIMLAVIVVQKSCLTAVLSCEILHRTVRMLGRCHHTWKLEQIMHA